MNRVDLRPYNLVSQQRGWHGRGTFVLDSVRYNLDNTTESIIEISAQSCRARQLEDPLDGKHLQE